MAKKILILGSKGMAGHIIRQFFCQYTQHAIIDIARGSDIFRPTYILDVTDFSTLKKILDSERPDYVINCIGVLNQDAETNPDKAVLLNAYFPHFLAKQCSLLSSKLIHISTDCVFDGSKGNYAEQDFKDGKGLYAQSKALGEVDYGNHLTIRTSIVGPELKPGGIGLLHWFLHQTGEISGYSRAFWSGVTTLQLAKSLNEIINENELTGICHLTNGTRISKYELLLIFADVFDSCNISIKADSKYQVDKSLINTRKDVNLDVPSYATMIKEVHSWMRGHAALYQSIYGR